MLILMVIVFAVICSALFSIYIKKSVLAFLCTYILVLSAVQYIFGSIAGSHSASAIVDTAIMVAPLTIITFFIVNRLIKKLDHDKSDEKSTKGTDSI